MALDVDGAVAEDRDEEHQECEGHAEGEPLSGPVAHQSEGFVVSLVEHHGELRPLLAHPPGPDGLGGDGPAHVVVVVCVFVLVVDRDGHVVARSFVSWR